MSIGRSQGQHITSKDSLPAHPLLSPAPSATSTPTLSPSVTLVSGSPSSQPTISLSPNQAQTKYVPYTPRHRPVPSTSTATASVTTGTNATGSPTSSGASLGGATRELQRQNMKSEMQGLGLSGESAGWGMLDKLSSLAAADEEWEEVWGMITVGKATLLLPREPLPNSELTADLVRHHVVFLLPPCSSPTPLVTLSGLRGIIDNSSLTFRSFLPTDSTQYTNLIAATTRAPTLQNLPPLPQQVAHDLPTPYPSFQLIGQPSLVPLPPRPSPVPPPLPTRPKPAPHTTNRLVSLPFSLWGSKSASSTPPAAAATPAHTAPATPTATAPNPAAGGTTAAPGATATTATAEGPTIDVWPIDHILRTRDITQGFTKSIRSEIKLALSGLPTWLTDRVTSFVLPFLPVVKQPHKPSKLRTSLAGTSGAANSGIGSGPPSPVPEMKPSSEQFQQFYAAIHGDLLLYYEHSGSPTGSLLRGPRGSRELERDATAAKGSADDKERERERELDEKALLPDPSSADSVREAVDRVEALVCTLLYDRLFRPPESDDERHDEALASRIAALNMLDLGLEHLGVDVLPSKGSEGGAGREEVEEVVRACGQELQKLPLYQAPKEKAAILVTAHKLVADGLARLPPLRLRPEPVDGEGEMGEGEKTARPTVAPSEPEVQDGEMTAKPLLNGTKPSTGEQEDEQELQEHVNGHALEQQLHASMEEELFIAQRDHVTSPGVASPEEAGQDAIVRTPPPVPALRLPAEAQANGELEVDHSHPPPLPPRHHSPPPAAARSRSAGSSPVPQATAAADLMLPLIIFAVVKSNPAQLVSNLLYVQRYRDSTIGGEENYCLINLSAVVEFLEHVDLGVLGLGGQEKVLSIDDLTPIPLVRSPQAAAQAEAVENMGGRLRGTVNQVGELAASTNKVISGVVDSSFSALRGLLTQSGPVSPEALSTGDDLAKIAPWNGSRPGFGLLRRASGFSIASMAASLPGGHGRARSMVGREEDEDEEGGRPLVDVSSRANSIREERETDTEEDDEEGSDEGTTGTSGQTEEEDEDDDEGEDGDRERGYRSDVRSVRSFSSMMSRESRDRDDRRERMSIQDRLASMAAGRFHGKSPSGGSGQAALHQEQGHAHTSGRRQSPPRSRRTSLLSPGLPAGHASQLPQTDSRSPSPSRLEQSPTPIIAPLPVPVSAASSPITIPKIPGPSTRFMTCSPDELRLSEIGELLREYRRVVGALKAVGGFEES